MWSKWIARLGRGVPKMSRTIAFKLFTLFAIAQLATIAIAQTAVTTNRYDNSRSGQNISEAALNPTNVKVDTFGRLWTYILDGQVYAQPLYLPGVDIPGQGKRNVVFVATEHDTLYALDADGPGGEVTTPLWSRSFINPQSGITTVTPDDVNCWAILPELGITSTPVIDPASGTIFTVVFTKENGNFYQRLHAMDVSTGAERPGSPVTIDATYPGTGDGSVNGQIAFNSRTQLQRPGLLLSNGAVYIAWGSHCDNDPYHGWIIKYDKDTLQQTGVWMSTPNGSEGGIWMSGTGLATDTPGNIFAVIGNGTFDEGTDTPLNFGDSVVKLSPDGYNLKVLDFFTPYNEAYLAANDLDVGTSGPLILPPQLGFYPFEALTGGKQGRIYLMDRTQMGHFNSNGDAQIRQTLSLPRGLFTNAVYWNGTVFTGGVGDTIRAYKLSTRGLLSTAPTSVSSQTYSWPGASLVASSNKTSGGILWALETSVTKPFVLHAYDATNLGRELYNSSQNLKRDRPGSPVKFAVPTVANGKVYVGGDSTVSVFGLLASMTPQPSISPWGGTYGSGQTVSLTDSRPDATIYYTSDGTTPTVSSPVYTGPFQVDDSSIIKALAIAPGAAASNISVADFTIVPGSKKDVINFSDGFAPSVLNLQGSARIIGTRLRLTDGGTGQTATAWYPTPVNVQAFAQDFRIQITDALADGMTFTIQNASGRALGFAGGSLGYAPITSSVAVKFDIFNNAGEGATSTGLYTGGNSPTVPAIDLTRSNVDLHSGHIFSVHMTYDGALLSMDLRDTETNQVFSTQWTIDIPATVGSATAYIGFSGGTGGYSATQDVLSWTFVSGGSTPTPSISPWGGSYTSAQTVSISDDNHDAVIHYTTDGSTPTPNSPVYQEPFTVQSSAVVQAIAVEPGLSPSQVRQASFTILSGGEQSVDYGRGFNSVALNLQGTAQLVGTRLRLTPGGIGDVGSAWLANPVGIQSFTQDFLLQLGNANADGLTFVIQNVGNTALGFAGKSLGYSPLSPSAAVKFDIYDNDGEGPNSTGLYTAGAFPTLPATDLRGTPIDLHSGHVLAIHMTYDGTTLSMQITDMETNQSYSTNWNIDLPAAVGGSTAYVGFAAATGGATAVQDALTWTFVSQAAPRGGPRKDAGPLRLKAPTGDVAGKPASNH